MLRILSAQSAYPLSGKGLEYDQRQQAANEIIRLSKEENWQYLVKAFTGKSLVLLLPPSGVLSDIIIGSDIVEVVQQVNNR